MKVVQIVVVMATLLLMGACSKSEEEQTKEPLVNHSNTGQMGKQLEGNPFQGYGDALDKGHNVTDTLQSGADKTKVQDELQNQ